MKTLYRVFLISLAFLVVNIPSSLFASEKCNVEFCRQGDHYYNGIEGIDEIVIDCIQGPNNATVSNQENGEYIVTGTYRLGTFNTATINLRWGGSASYSGYKDEYEYEIDSPGEGSFTIRIEKISGGSGNLFLSMKYGSTRIVDAVALNTDCPIMPDSSCVSAKLKAASTLCKSLAKCCSKDLKKPDDNKLGASLDKAYAKFEKSWTEVEDKAIKKGLNCDTDDASEFISSIDDGGIYLIHQEIEANVPDTKDGRKLASSLMKAAGVYCSSIFKAESAYAKKPDAGKLNISLGKALAKFQRSWYKAINKAGKKGVTYNGDIGAITAIIEDMEDDVLDGMQ